MNLSFFNEIDAQKYLKKDKSIETLRGIAITLLVLFHAREFIQNESYHFINYILDPVRMPLFASISGFLYANRPLTGSPLSFLKGKIRRIIIPCFVILTIWLLLNYLSFHFLGNNSLIQIKIDVFSLRRIIVFYLFRPTTYWFCQAIFTVFVAVVVLERLRLLYSLRNLLIIISFLLVLTALILKTNTGMFWSSFFSINGAMYLSIFFFLGMAVNKYSDILFQKYLIAIYFAIFSLCLYYLVLAYDGGTMQRVMKYSHPACLGLSIFGVLLIYRFKFTNTLFSKIGYYAFVIYLYHRFCFSLTNALVVWLDFENVALIVALSLSLILPIITYRIFINNKVTKILFLGEK
jgi:Fucose 4-O-acetylase and related acetyltransferases